MLKLDYALSDLELSKMTLRDLGPQALVLRNTSISGERLRRYELGRTNTTATVY
jgi:hypothetical protein